MLGLRARRSAIRRPGAAGGDVLLLARDRAGEYPQAHLANYAGIFQANAISAVFTITWVAAMLGEDEEWLHELSIDMFPEDGCLRVYGVGEDGVTAFTDYGIEC